MTRILQANGGSKYKCTTSIAPPTDRPRRKKEGGKEAGMHDGRQAASKEGKKESARKKR